MSLYVRRFVNRFAFLAKRMARFKMIPDATQKTTPPDYARGCLLKIATIRTMFADRAAPKKILP